MKNKIQGQHSKTILIIVIGLAVIYLMGAIQDKLGKKEESAFLGVIEFCGKNITGIKSYECYQNQLFPLLEMGDMNKLANRFLQVCERESVTHTCLHGLGYTIAKIQKFNIQSIRRGCDLETPVVSKSHCEHGAMVNVVLEMGIEKLGRIREECYSAYNQPSDKPRCRIGIGHGLALLEEFNITKALSDCELLASWEHEHCWRGVFLENWFSGPLANDPWYPCTVVEERHQAICSFFQPRLMRSHFALTIPEIVDMCFMIGDEKMTRECFNGLSADIGRRSRGDAEFIKKNCVFMKGSMSIEQCSEIAQSYADEIKNRTSNGAL